MDDVNIGDHVVLSWAPFCGKCFYCIRNKPNLCDTYTAPIWAGTMLDGTTRLSRTRAGKREPVYSYCGTASFATHTVVPRGSCVVIRKDKEIKLDRVALIGCAIATGVGAVLNTANVKAGETVVVFGCGGVGLSIIQGARSCAASQIIAIDAEPTKRFIPHHFGATSFLQSTDDIVAAVRHHTGGRGSDHVFEAIGNPKVQELALECVRPGGTLTLAGLAPMGSTTNFPSSIIAKRNHHQRQLLRRGERPARFPDAGRSLCGRETGLGRHGDEAISARSNQRGIRRDAARGVIARGDHFLKFIQQEFEPRSHEDTKRIPRRPHASCLRDFVVDSEFALHPDRMPRRLHFLRVENEVRALRRRRSSSLRDRA